MEKHEPLAQVRIRTDGPIAEVFIDGHKVPRVMAFKAEMNAMEKRGSMQNVVGCPNVVNS